MTIHYRNFLLFAETEHFFINRLFVLSILYFTFFNNSIPGYKKRNILKVIIIDLNKFWMM